MKKMVFVLACCLAVGGASAAGGKKRVTAVQAFVGFGLTAGGDNLATVQFSNGDTKSMHAGSLLEAMAGVDVRFTPMWSAQASVGYHVDTVSGTNGAMKFERTPVEFLAHVNLRPELRLGGGIRYISGAKLSGSGVLSGDDVRFGVSRGTVVQGEYFPRPDWGVRLRYVTDRFPINGETVDGSHFSLHLNYYF